MEDAQSRGLCYGVFQGQEKGPTLGWAIFLAPWAVGAELGAAEVKGPCPVPLLPGQARESLQLGETTVSSVLRKAPDQASSSAGSDGEKVTNSGSLAAGQHSDALPPPQVCDRWHSSDARIIVA